MHAWDERELDLTNLSISEQFPLEQVLRNLQGVCSACQQLEIQLTEYLRNLTLGKDCLKRFE